MSNSFILIGGGGHAITVYDSLVTNGKSVLGVAALDRTTSIPDLEFLGNDDAVLEYDSDIYRLANGIGSIGNLDLRETVYRKFSELGYEFPPIVHPSAVVATRAMLADGGQVMAGAVIQPDAVIGENSIINTRASVDHGCQIGRSVHIAPGAVLSGDVIVGDKTHIGTGASVVQGVKIGSGCLIGVGAAVITDVPNGTRVRAPVSDYSCIDNV